MKHKLNKEKEKKRASIIETQICSEAQAIQYIKEAGGLRNFLTDLSPEERRCYANNPGRYGNRFDKFQHPIQKINGAAKKTRRVANRIMQ